MATLLVKGLIAPPTYPKRQCYNGAMFKYLEYYKQTTTAPMPPDVTFRSH